VDLGLPGWGLVGFMWVLYTLWLYSELPERWPAAFVVGLAAVLLICALVTTLASKGLGPFGLVGGAAGVGILVFLPIYYRLVRSGLAAEKAAVTALWYPVSYGAILVAWGSGSWPILAALAVALVTSGLAVRRWTQPDQP
jgi:hypothetical protein